MFTCTVTTGQSQKSVSLHRVEGKSLTIVGEGFFVFFLVGVAVADTGQGVEVILIQFVGLLIMAQRQVVFVEFEVAVGHIVMGGGGLLIDAQHILVGIDSLVVFLVPAVRQA